MEQFTRNISTAVVTFPYWGFVIPALIGLMVAGSRDGMKRYAALGLGFLSLAWGWAVFINHTGLTIPNVVFSKFALGALAASMGMIWHRHPVYMSLLFAIAVLCTCGLFLLLGAPFIAASTIIVYAGAIIVTFLFVIMMAHQRVGNTYDTQLRQPFLPAVFCAILFLAIMFCVKDGFRPRSLDPSATGDPGTLKKFPLLVAQPPAMLSRPNDEQVVRGTRMLGRSMFGDYLLGVEVAGSILLVATVGAIAIAARKRGLG